MDADYGVWLKIMGFTQLIIIMLLSFSLKMFFSFGISIKGLQTWSEMHEKSDDKVHADLKEAINLKEKRKVVKDS